jgi:ATP-binding cassette subfamily B protein
MQLKEAEKINNNMYFAYKKWRMRLKNFRYSFKLVYAATKFYTWISIFPALIGSVMPFATVYLIKLIVDETIYAAGSPDKMLAFKKVLLLIIIAGICFLLNHLSNVFDAYIKDVREQKFFDYIFNRIHEKTTKIDIENFDDDKYYDLFSRAFENAQSRPLYVVNQTITVVQNSIALLSLAVLLLTLHNAVFLVLLLATVPLGLVKLKFSKALYKWVRDNTRKTRKTWYINDLLTREEFSMEIRLFVLSDYLIRLFKKLRTEIREGYLKIYKKRMLFEVLAQFMAAFAVFGAFGVISYNTVIGVLTVGSLTMYLIAIERGVSLFNLIFKDLSNIYADSLYVEYLEVFLDIPIKEKDRETNQKFPNPMHKGIVFKDVSFKYPSSKRSVLQNVNINIEAGKTVALVGANGSGKTTLIKLLSKFYAPDSGKILIDGQDLKDIQLSSVRENITALLQNFAHYNFTAAENIKFGKAGKDEGIEKIIDAAKKAQIDGLIQSLPYGYDTVLGKIYNDSEELSIGQWQKMGLARALYKDSQIVIMDEPTAALDAQAEYELFSIFKEVLKDKTVLLISHRFSTVQMADYIYVLDNESIAEQGTHKDLLKKNGLYAKMYNKQALYYQQ